MNVRELKRLIEHMDDETILWWRDEPPGPTPERVVGIGAAVLRAAGEDSLPSLIFGPAAP